MKSIFKNRLHILALTAAGFLSNSGCAPSQPSGALSSEDIKLAAGDLRSFASVSGLLCDEFSKGNASHTFFTSQADMLHEKASAAQKSLVGPAGDAEADRQHTELIARNIDAALLAVYSDPSSAGVKAPEFRSLSDEAKAVEDKLTK